MRPVDVIFSEGQQRILAQLMLRTDRSRSTNELIGISGKGRATGQKLLDDMARSGMLWDFRIGNQRHFQANPDFIFFDEIRSICVKSFGLADVIRDALSHLANEIDFAFVFGSIAKGKERPGSDIDLMVVGEADLFAVSMALEGAEKQLGRSIHSNLYSLSEWENVVSKQSTMGSILKGERIPVMGKVPE
jgi:predicted nucleotidyltransferase